MYLIFLKKSFVDVDGLSYVCKNGNSPQKKRPLVTSLTFVLNSQKNWIRS